MTDWAEVLRAAGSGGFAQDWNVPASGQSCCRVRSPPGPVRPEGIGPPMNGRTLLCNKKRANPCFCLLIWSFVLILSTNTGAGGAGWRGAGQKVLRLFYRSARAQNISPSQFSVLCDADRVPNTCAGPRWVLLDRLARELQLDHTTGYWAARAGLVPKVPIDSHGRPLAANVARLSVLSTLAGPWPLRGRPRALDGHLQCAHLCIATISN